MKFEKRFSKKILCGTKRPKGEFNEMTSMTWVK